MMNHHSAPWHKHSFDGFIHEKLPELLESRMPLTSYAVQEKSTYSLEVIVGIKADEGEMTLTFPALPQPDEQGIFKIDTDAWVVVPVADAADLATAHIRCAGEQLYDYIAARLGEAPEDLPIDEETARAWLPLDECFRTFLTSDRQEEDGRIVKANQALESANWLSIHTHLRRLIKPRYSDQVVLPESWDGICPITTPEGPNIGRILYVSLGAEIRDGRIVVIDNAPEKAIGLAAAMVPFIEHNQTTRTLFGSNAMRQWVSLSEPEPALIQTGYEPDGDEFRMGVNLLTAFMSWDMGTHEDGLVISTSGAQRLRNPEPVEPGDKLTTRHGVAGVVTRVLPDEDMPKMQDGTPVEMIVSLMSLPSRMNMGALREAVMGRLARTEGHAIIVPPFKAPGRQEIQQRLKKAGLPENGMETLSLDGKPLDHPSTVGCVYWGCTNHQARRKVHASATVTGHNQFRGQWEYYMMRNIGAFETIREANNTLAVERTDAETLPDRVKQGTIEQAGPPTPRLARLAGHLAAAGIRAALDKDSLSFTFTEPEKTDLALARPMPHPWLHERSITAVGRVEGVPGYDDLEAANTRLARMINSKAPAHLIQKAENRLKDCLNIYFQHLLTPDDLRFRSRVMFTGRSVVVPGEEVGRPRLTCEQAGVPDDIAWTIFGPQVIRETGDAAAVSARTTQAAAALDRIMADSWILLMRAPVVTPTGIIAFKPVRTSDRAIHVHPFVCDLMNGDFDGDQMALFLPMTAAGQAEAEEKLSLVGHLQRDPELLLSFLPAKDALFGLVLLSLTETGRQEINKLAGVDIPVTGDYLNRHTLLEAMQSVLEQEGAEKTIGRLEQMMHLGYEAAGTSGASIGAFAELDMDSPAPPVDDDPSAWTVYADELAGRIAMHNDYDDPATGMLLLASHSGARGNTKNLMSIVGIGGVVADAAGKVMPVKNSYTDGVTPNELYALAYEGLTNIAKSHHLNDFGSRFNAANHPQAPRVLSRAMRSPYPGIVFARAAAAGEIDPLIDIDARLFVGLPAS